MCLNEKKHIRGWMWGGGVLYEEHEICLKGLNNQYACMDIEETHWIQARIIVVYVDFKCLDIHDYPKNELGKHDVILMVQTYVCVPNIDKVIKRYFKQNTNGKIIMINTIFPEYLTGISNIGREVIVKGWFGVNWGKALTLNYVIEMSKRMKRHLTYNIIGQSPSGNDEYIMILE